MVDRSVTSTHPDCPLLDRRAMLQRLLALGLSASPAAALLTGCGDDRESPMNGMDGMGGAGKEMPGWMMSRGEMDEQLAEHMAVIHDLLIGHEKIARQVKDIPGGIRSETTSDDPTVADLIRTHVQQMRSRIERGEAIRQMDPVFREIFDHHETISMDITDLANGTRVVETSSDPQVELLIRQHAHRAVSEFVDSGMSRAMRPTPLPPGYTNSA